MKKRRVVTVALSLVALSVLSIARVYAVRDIDTGAQLLWSKDEAYLIVGLKRLGWSMSYLYLPFQAFLELNNQPAPAQQMKSSVVVVRLTANGEERRVADDVGMSSYTVVDGRIASSSGLVWTGDRFEKANPQMWSAIGSPSAEFSEVGGWSKRSLPFWLGARDETYDFNLDDVSVRVTIVNSTEAGAITLKRNGQPEARLVFVERRTRYVRGSDYRELFQNGSTPTPDRGK